MYEAVCAGHVCLDMTPRFPREAHDLQTIFRPGQLNRVGSMNFAVGGSVSNTGLGMNRLGVRTALVGRVGCDDIGQMIAQFMDIQTDGCDQLSFAEGEDSSYSVVIAVPGSDRVFLHNPGANDHFTGADVPSDLLRRVRLLHFGYSPLMRAMFLNDGEETRKLLERAKEERLTTSVDTAMPDPESEAGKVNWRAYFENILPFTDIVTPSVEELLMMIRPELYRQMREQSSDVLEVLDLDLLPELAGELLGMGAAIVAIKCGDRGFYLKTGSEQEIEEMGGCTPENVRDWVHKDIFCGIFEMDDVKSTNGAGDASIAGLLSALMNGLSAEEAVQVACAAGALSVTSYATTEDLPPMYDIIHKIHGGWTAAMPRYSGTYFVASEVPGMLTRRA